MENLACPGDLLASGLPVGPCHTCRLFDRSASDKPLVAPAVVWLETSRRVGYSCRNHLPSTDDSETTWRLLSALGGGQVFGGHPLTSGADTQQA